MTRLVKAAAGRARVGSPSGSGDGAVATVSAVIATITPGVVDSHGDAYDPGAFVDSGTAVISQWSHSSVYSGGAIPVGVGSVQEVGDLAVFDGVIFLGMSAGRDTFEWLRQRGTEQEWSYGLDVLKSRAPNPAELRAGARQVLQRLAVPEVSPVWRGAGVATQTLRVEGPPPAAPAAGGDGLDAATRAELEAIAERLRGQRNSEEAVAGAVLRLVRHQAEQRRAASR
ncbi:hypothetical protein [Micromonospora aurantiaca (nom. illeg.)]|uniref:hypothetical protein n=1 Tax=Micromonospora aurantiaca (nom. illeg.) TaxID=47850 RepID=UPI0016173F19